MNLSTIRLAWAVKTRSITLMAAGLAAALLAGTSSGGQQVAAQDHELGPLPFTLTFAEIARDGAAPTLQDSFVVTVVVTSSPQNVTFELFVTAEAAMTVLVDFELYALDDGGRVLQEPFFGQKLQAGVTKKLTYIWTPEPGQKSTQYVAKVGIFSPGWEVLFHWSDSAAVFSYP